MRRRYRHIPCNVFLRTARGVRSLPSPAHFAITQRASSTKLGRLALHQQAGAEDLAGGPDADHRGQGGAGRPRARPARPAGPVAGPAA